MTRFRCFVIALVLVAAGVGGFYLYRWLTKSPGQATQLKSGDAHVRIIADVPAIRFVDVTEKSGINFRHFNGATPQKLLPETMGGGVAIFDYDGDGKPDILFINGRPWPGVAKPGEAPPTMKLYRNKGDFTFEDV